MVNSTVSTRFLGPKAMLPHCFKVLNAGLVLFVLFWFWSSILMLYTVF